MAIVGRGIHIAAFSGVLLLLWGDLIFRVIGTGDVHRSEERKKPSEVIIQQTDINCTTPEIFGS